MSILFAFLPFLPSKFQKSNSEASRNVFERSKNAESYTKCKTFEKIAKVP